MNRLLNVAEADALIRARVPGFGTERIRLDQATGRVLAEVIHAERDSPPYDRVMMDGVALRFATSLPAVLHLAGTQAAGRPALHLTGPNDCFEVMTGAMLPLGCDCVVPVEQLTINADQVRLNAPASIQAGQFVHRRGSDCRKSDALIGPGIRLRGPELAVLAANGWAEVAVARLPSIGIISTGDELMAIEAPLESWQIRRSNDRAIATAIQARGLGEAHCSHVGDDLAATTALLEAQLAAHQVLILSGGVSMGQRDYVPAALQALGVEKIFHRIAQRPGKPMWFGIGPRGQAVFALPGNPVSTLTCTLRHVLPALEMALGLPAPQPLQVVLSSVAPTHPELTCFVPAILHQDRDSRLTAQPMPARTSGDFSGLTGTDGLLELAPAPQPAPAGSVASFYRW